MTQYYTPSKPLTLIFHSKLLSFYGGILGDTRFNMAAFSSRPRALGGFDVATGLSRQVDDNAACLHAINVLLGGDRGLGEWAFSEFMVV
jgi:hypothetical protein